MRASKLLCLVALQSSAVLAAPNLNTLVSFNGINGSGAAPGRFFADHSGNLFGVTQSGGPDNDGTVYEFSTVTDSLTTLANFNGSNGKTPFAGVFVDSVGDAFGTTQYGGANSLGTVFEVASGSNAITTIATFNVSNGAQPAGDLISDADGNLYGTTLGGSGGDTNYGTVFKIAAGSRALTTIAVFNGSNGQTPYCGLTADASGNLFGTTRSGGANGDGTVFKIAAGTNALSVVGSFSNAAGTKPIAGLIVDSAGNLYGATQAGGLNNDGSIYEIAAGMSKITTLASFNYSNGRGGDAYLLSDANGNLFGTTALGGLYGDGTIFELPAGSNSITTLINFNGSNGEGAYSGLSVDVAGNLYGSTFQGGTTGNGTIFEVSSSGYVVPEPGCFCLAVTSFAFLSGRWRRRTLLRTTDRKPKLGQASIL